MRRSLQHAQRISSTPCSLRTQPVRAETSLNMVLVLFPCWQSLMVLLLVMDCADDQAETVLMRLSRASGIDGLAGMSACSNLRDAAPGHSTAATDSPRPVASSTGRKLEHAHQQGRARLLRPLLWASKTELQSLLREADVSWLEDPTNADTNFTRNFIRHLPGMQPLCAEHLVRQTKPDAAERSAVKQSEELPSVSGPDKASALSGPGLSQTHASDPQADLLRIAAVCAEASQSWTSAAADVLTACVRPLSAVGDRPTAVGCSLDVAQLSQAPLPVMNRALSATMQVIHTQLSCSVFPVTAVLHRGQCSDASLQDAELTLTHSLHMQAVARSPHPPKQRTVLRMCDELRQTHSLRALRTGGGCLFRPVTGSRGSKATVVPL